MNKLSTLILVLISVFFISCGGGSGGRSDNSTDSTPTTPTVPTIESFSGTVLENLKSGEAVGTIFISNSGSTPISSISLSGSGYENFVVSNSGIITASSTSNLDYETTISYSLSAIATNSVGNSARVAVNINISDYIHPLQIAKIQASDAEANDNFGNSVSISGDYIVIGAKYEDTTASNAGSAYLFKKQIDGTLTQIAKLQASDAEAGDSFGYSVSISGDYIIVGAFGEDTTADRAGSAYLFKINSDAINDVTQIAKIQASDAERDDFFGISVSISGDYIVVGARYADSAGSAYLFKINSDTINDVTQIAKLQASDAEEEDSFGYSVSISGDYIAVGAYGEDTLASNAGSAYLFKRNSDDINDVTQIAKLQASDAESDDKFGNSVSISGDYIVVGANGEDTTATNAGSAYLFKINLDAINDVTQIAKIQASDAESWVWFGNSVSISGDYIVVGAKYEDTTATNAGSAYIFQRNSDTLDDVTQVAKLQASDAEEGDEFGDSVSINEGCMAIGASGAGSTYLFDLEPLEKVYMSLSTDTFIYPEMFLNKPVYNFNASSVASGDITYSLDGLDASSFSFTDNKLSFLSAADYEIPADSTVDNSYSIEVTATDTNNNSASVNLNILVEDSYYLEIAKTKAFDAESGDYFGESVSISGDYIVVGAKYEDTIATNAGSAYLFKKQLDGTLAQIAKLQASDAEEYDNFGCSVSISGDYIVVGAYGEDTTANNAGSAYIFKRNSDTINDITQIAKIQASDSASWDNFGNSVSISGDYIVVGAYGEDTIANSAGSAYLFKINSDTINDITQIAKVQASDAEEDDNFGNSVSISGDYIVVGADGEDIGGSAYLFKINSDAINDVTQIAKIQASDAEEYDNFGESVSISGDYIVVGADGENTSATDAGSAYLFKRNSDTLNDITQIAKIQASDAEGDDYFGNSVSISGDYIVVGATGEDTTANRAGSAYIFKRNSDTPNDVTQIVKIQASNAGYNDNFGCSVSTSEGYIVVGAYQEDTTASDSGAIYLYEKDSNQVE